MSHSVLFRDFPVDHLDASTNAVSKACGISSIDAQSKIRRGWGFLERNVTEQQALELVKALAQHGVAALSISNETIRTPQDPKVIVGFESDADGFTPAIQLTRYRTRHIKWDEVIVVAAGGFSEDVIRLQAAEGKSGAAKMIGIGVFLATGVPMGLFGGKKKEVKEIKRSQFISFGQIVTRDLESFCFDPEHFDYAGLGKQKQLNTVLNFRVMICEFARLTPARLNMGARLVLDKKSLALANYLRTSDFETELQWLVNTTRESPPLTPARDGPNPTS